MMRQNMELQQRQSSLERRAAFQKGLLAANRDHMQVLFANGKHCAYVILQMRCSAGST